MIVPRGEIESKSKPFDKVNEFKVYGPVAHLTVKSVFTDTYSYCLLSERCFKKIKRKGLVRSTSLPGFLPDELESLIPVCAISLGYYTSKLLRSTWQELFIVVKHLPLPEGVSVDCNISIVFTGQIRDNLEAILKERQQLLREATEMDEENGGETQPNQKQGDVDHGDWSLCPIRTKADTVRQKAIPVERMRSRL
jgi:hypothetical protein